jgi:hypothetical protein
VYESFLSTIYATLNNHLPFILLRMGFEQVLHFDYEKFKGKMLESLPKLDFRAKDWGPAPRWVAFVDFFLASRARYAVVSGAQRRVGTTYAQLIAALAAAHNLGTCTTYVTPVIFVCYSS